MLREYNIDKLNPRPNPYIKNIERYCSIEDSIQESLKEINLMRKGKTKKNTLDDLWKQIEKWKKEMK